MQELLLVPLTDAFAQVGVFVAVLAGIVAWTRVRYGASALDVLVRHPRWAPLLGAVCGVTPGCGGAILVTGLYLKRRASYGSAVAALTATMGDAAFVIIALDPVLALGMHVVLLVAGTITGYAVDAVGMDPRRSRVTSPARVAVGVGLTDSGAGVGVGAGAGVGDLASGLEAPSPWPAGRGCAPAFLRAAYSPPSDDALRVVAPPGGLPAVGLRARLTGVAPLVAGLGPAATLLWVATVLGLLVVVPTTIFGVDPAILTAALGGVDPVLVLGLLGTAASLLVFFQAGCRLCDDGDLPPGDLAAALRHAAVETAFVVVWVAVALLAVQLLTALAVVDVSALALAGVSGVLLGVAVALLPGCGVQIAFTGLYAAGALPFPALLANAVAQDGDALLPMLAQDRRTAVVTTVLTSLPAVLVGLAALVVV